MEAVISNTIIESINVKKKLLDHTDTITAIAKKMCECFSTGKKVLFCGNGGSAADSMHLEGEFVCRFTKNRRALPAIALGSGLPTISAIGNDLGFVDVFSRQVEAYAVPGDILVAISTSGNSDNLLKAVTTAKGMGIYTVGFLGGTGGKLASLVDCSLIIPSKVTARIQECHILVGHILCGIVEMELFGHESSIS